ncbi:MAG: HEAT repeat domain-containing protein, partial [Planctomycetota bacterium]
MGAWVGWFAAATVLGWLRDERTVVPLIKGMKDNADEVRLAAIKALGEIGDEKASEPLALLLENEEAHTALWLAGLASL